MRVKYTPQNIEYQNVFLINHPECVCLGIMVYQDKTSVLIMDEDSIPIQANIKDFEFINQNIPENWICEYDNSVLCIVPEEFRYDFLERYHDGDCEAEKTFKEVVNKIYAFHGLPPHFVEEKESEPLKEHEWWKEYLDEDER